MDPAGEIERRARPVVEAAGVELVDLQFRPESNGWVLRFYLDKPGGFGLADCEMWSDRLGTLVEESGLVRHAYSLEVSSPGLARPLKKREDFERFRGMEAVVKTRHPIHNQRHFHGRIEAVEEGTLMLTDRTNGRVSLPLEAVASATLDPTISMDEK